MAETGQSPGQPGEAMAYLLNLTVRRLQQLAAEGTIPKPVDGRYELVGTVRGYVRYLQELAAGQSQGLVTERARVVREQADKLARENALARGELVPAGEVEDVLQAAFGRCRARLLALPSQVAPRLAAESDLHRCHDIVKEQIHDVCRELARTGSDFADDADIGADGADPAPPLRGDDGAGGAQGVPGVGATAAADGEPMG